MSRKLKNQDLEYDSNAYDDDAYDDDAYDNNNNNSNSQNGYQSAAAAADGPYTYVSLLSWLETTGRQCSCSTFIPILTGVIFLTDILFVIFVGLDIVNAGLNEPWLQFSWSIAIATLYSTLCMASFVQYRWERVLRFRFHWLLALCVCTILSWITFGVWASWLTQHPDHASNIKYTNTGSGAYVTWVATNAVGLAGFFGRLIIISVAFALSYTYNRVLEVQDLVVIKNSGGQGLRSLLGKTKNTRKLINQPYRRYQPQKAQVSKNLRRYRGTNYYDKNQNS